MAFTRFLHCFAVIKKDEGKLRMRHFSIASLRGTSALAFPQLQRPVQRVIANSTEWPIWGIKGSVCNSF